MRSLITLTVFITITIALLSAAYNHLGTTIANNRTANLTANLRQAFPMPEGTSHHAIYEVADGLWTVCADGARIGQIQRIVVEGYAAPIALAVGLGLENAPRIQGISVLEQQETPGLGDKILPAKSSWLRQFQGYALGDAKLALKPHGDIDGITAATITAQAITQGLRQTTAKKPHKQCSAHAPQQH